jgi:hypothetical protein
MGPLSLVLVLLREPKQPFVQEDQDRFRVFLQGYGADDVRLLPISFGQPDHPPAPLDHLKAFPLHNLKDAALVRRLATRILNLLCLRVASPQRKLFISYKSFDGADWARRAQKLLEHVGYQVWRDESLDRDGVTAIAPGSSAQTAIHEAILRHGFVLVIDTVQSPTSTWVCEEIDTAIKFMLPILPLVICDPAQPANPALEAVPIKLGGRFRELSQSQHEVRVGLDRRADLENAIDGDDWQNPKLVDFLNGLELEIRDRLLQNLRVRRELLHEAEDRFRRLRFRQVAVSPDCLLFSNDRSLDTADSPGLAFRLLVQYAPYDSLLDQTVGNLCQHFRAQNGPYQYAVLVHRTSTCAPEIRRLIHGRGNHLLIMRSDELPKLAAIFRLD